jgi:hypothetical protein
MTPKVPAGACGGARAHDTARMHRWLCGALHPPVKCIITRPPRPRGDRWSGAGPSALRKSSKEPRTRRCTQSGGFGMGVRCGAARPGPRRSGGLVAVHTRLERAACTALAAGPAAERPRALRGQRGRGMGQCGVPRTGVCVSCGAGAPHGRRLRRWAPQDEGGECVCMGALTAGVLGSVVRRCFRQQQPGAHVNAQGAGWRGNAGMRGACGCGEWQAGDSPQWASRSSGGRSVA